LHAQAAQIDWEHRHLNRADVVAFWFAAGILCPITLFELGTCCASAAKKIVVGADLGYEKRTDVQIQLGLRRRDVAIVSSLEELAQEVGQQLVIPPQTAR
jgi:hypothetical protein